MPGVWAPRRVADARDLRDSAGAGRQRPGERLGERKLSEDHEGEPILRFFSYEHLPPHLAVISQHFAALAALVVKTLPRNPERSTALRKLLEAKDCAVRTLL